MPCEGRFVTSYFGDDPNIGKLVYSMLHQEPERRPEMEQVLVQMVEINVEQRYKSMTIRQESLQQELDEVRAQKNDLQVQNSSLRGELNVVKAKKSDLQVQNTSLGGKVNVVEIQKNDLQVQICSLRDELNRLTAEKNELQIEVEQWRKSASQVVFLFFVFISLGNSRYQIDNKLNYDILRCVYSNTDTRCQTKSARFPAKCSKHSKGKEQDSASGQIW